MHGLGCADSTKRQQWGAQICVLCCADESIGRVVSTEGFTCVVYRLKHTERLCQKKGFKCTPVWFELCRLKHRERGEGVQTYTCMVCVVQFRAERDTVWTDVHLCGLCCAV